MAETYCGKNCADCAAMQNETCPGCRVGPGRTIGGECELARCCRTRGHESCDTCVSRGTCWTLGDRFSQPEKRLKKLEWEQQQRQGRVRRSILLGKWTWYLFWLNVPAVIVGILAIEELVALIPALKMPGQLLELVLSLAYGLILLKMSPEEHRFRTAAWCILGAMAAQGFFKLVLGVDELPLLASLPLAAVSLFGEYQQFQGFGDSLSGVDNDLSGKWETLWKWYIGSYGVMLGSVLLALLSPMLAVLGILAAGIAQVAVGIMQMIYTYRTAKAFEYYSLRP